MSLAPFNGSIANPAQSAVSLGGNDLTNVGNTDIGGTFGVSDLAQFNGNIFVNATGNLTPQIEFTNGATGAQTATISYNVIDNVFSIDKPFLVISDGATATMSFNTTAGYPLTTTYNATDGFRTYTQNANNTFIFGATGATGATPYLKVDGVLGQGRVFDTIYNPLPTFDSACFCSDTTLNIGGTGATGVANTAAQLPLTVSLYNVGYTAVGTASGNGFKVLKSGTYNVNFQVQFFNNGSGNHNVWCWLRVGSTDVPNSSTGLYLQGNNAQQVPFMVYTLTLNANDIISIWAASDSSTTQALATPAITSPYSRPATASVIANIIRIA
jgi:hypothetical protein